MVRETGAAGHRIPTSRRSSVADERQATGGADQGDARARRGPPQSWRGQIFVGPQVGVFRGIAGDNALHAHGAHQLSVGLDSLVTIHGPARPISARAVFIAASSVHRVEGRRVLSVYADVSGRVGIAKRASAGSLDPIARIPDRLAARLAALGGGEGELDAEVVTGIAQELGGGAACLEPDPALARVARALSQPTAPDAIPRRRELASLLGMSESRFSHWFRERAGMPMQTYRKWQRLTRAVERILDGEPMAAAAAQAGFADQAHFVRTFRAMFGINPVRALGRARKQ
ncbi:MAG: AraC family transcriptional regulator [Deltaproteobacteria bacterium]|nr:AraC family transcriptional regulator [Deltaproteobacteria bacterium]